MSSWIGLKFISDSGSPFWCSGVDDNDSFALNRNKNVSQNITLKIFLIL